MTSKSKASIQDASYCILAQIGKVNAQLKRAIDAVVQSVKASVWHAHSGRVQLCLLAGARHEDRQLAAAQIVGLSNDRTFGDIARCPRITPKIIPNVRIISNIVSEKPGQAH